jgi:hypothetical protein
MCRQVSGPTLTLMLLSALASDIGGGGSGHAVTDQTRSATAEDDSKKAMKGSAIPLATVVREGIFEIAKLRLSRTHSSEKSLELYEYIVGDKFSTRFREMADCIESLGPSHPHTRSHGESLEPASAGLSNQQELLSSLSLHRGTVFTKPRRSFQRRPASITKPRSKSDNH